MTGQDGTRQDASLYENVGMLQCKGSYVQELLISTGVCISDKLQEGAHILRSELRLALTPEVWS